MAKPPVTPSDLVSELVRLHEMRETRKAAGKANGGIARQSLKPAERARVLAKTDSRCHICGGPIEPGTRGWHADHVLAHSAGGTHNVDNYLPACATCNNYRWDYGHEEFQWILKLGVWLRTQVERRTKLGSHAAELFMAYEAKRVTRRSAGRAKSRVKVDSSRSSGIEVREASVE